MCLNPMEEVFTRRARPGRHCHHTVKASIRLHAAGRMRPCVDALAANDDIPHAA